MPDDSNFALRNEALRYEDEAAFQAYEARQRRYEDENDNDNI